MSQERLAIGCMTGTSLDALDVCAVRAGGSGLGLTCAVVDLCSRSLADVGLGSKLRALAEGVPTTAGDIARLALEFGEFHAAAIAALTARVGKPALVAVHGQTIFHAPPVSWQMVNPWPIARAIGCPVVSDLRGADLACGGQGAPITPLADWVLFRSADQSRALVNLGGFCNITLLPAGGGERGLSHIKGFDVCACNHVLDGAARAALGKAYDVDGAAAESGRADEPAAAELSALLARQRGAGRSLGTGDESLAWVKRWGSKLRGPDLLASACEAIGRVIGAEVRVADHVVVAGGGAHNRALLAAIARHAGRGVATSDSLGVPIGGREAAEMAVLGLLSMDGVRITLPQVTGMEPGASLVGGSWVNPAAIADRTG